MDAHAAALGSLRDNIAALERSLAAHPDAVEGVRAEVRTVAKDLEAAQRSVSGECGSGVRSLPCATLGGCSFRLGSYRCALLGERGIDATHMGGQAQGLQLLAPASEGPAWASISCP